MNDYEDSSGRFNSFLTRFTGFCNWLCEIHDQLVELCETIPHRASQETITTHKNKLEVRGRGEMKKESFFMKMFFSQEFHNEVVARKSEFDELQTDGEETWGDHLVPMETVNQLRLDDSLPQSPVATTTTTSPDDREQNDFPFEEHLQQLPYFKNKMAAMTTKWGGVQRLLRDREGQLEMSLGNMVLFLEGVEEVVVWVGQWAGLPCVGGGIPASLSRLQTFLTGKCIMTQCTNFYETIFLSTSPNKLARHT